MAVLLRKDDGIDQLVAYVVPASGDPAPDGAALRQALNQHLPPYMVPGRYEQLALMPRLTSGKIDRKALRAMPLTAPAVASGESDLPETPTEVALFGALAVLFPGQPIRREADFFSDLGGHSFFAARLATALRSNPAFAHVTVRDIYQNRQIGKIAVALADAAKPCSAAEQDWTPPSGLRRWTCALAQAAAVPPLVTLRMTQWLAPFFTYHFFTGEPGDSVARAIAASIGVFLLATLLEFVVAIASKWLIGGRLRPGSYPLWGLTYYRWWLVDRLLEGAPVYLLSGCSLYVWWLRALGARVGNDVIIGSMTLRAPDLLALGDNVSIGNAVNFKNAVERGQLVLGHIDVANDACIASFSVLEGGTRGRRDQPPRRAVGPTGRRQRPARPRLGRFARARPGSVRTHPA
ncbi:hypothetical protein LP419_40915 [Massilia sp. H-1]|nr:hypothetical protein LP419_40915 [Massilia sp. H-1]